MRPVAIFRIACGAVIHRQACRAPKTARWSGPRVSNFGQGNIFRALIQKQWSFCRQFRVSESSFCILSINFLRNFCAFLSKTVCGMTNLCGSTEMLIYAVTGLVGKVRLEILEEQRLRSIIYLFISVDKSLNIVKYPAWKTDNGILKQRDMLTNQSQLFL